MYLVTYPVEKDGNSNLVDMSKRTYPYIIIILIVLSSLSFMPQQFRIHWVSRASYYHMALTSQVQKRLSQDQA